MKFRGIVDRKKALRDPGSFTERTASSRLLVTKSLYKNIAQFAKNHNVFFSLYNWANKQNLKRYLKQPYGCLRVRNYLLTNRIPIRFSGFNYSYSYERRVKCSNIERFNKHILSRFQVYRWFSRNVSPLIQAFETKSKASLLSAYVTSGGSI